ncbi:AAA family ATPase, partial [Actinomadura adrarensis]
AVQKLVDNVMVARAGLRDKSSVQGAFMFVGPSGTGKTEITKALADATGSELIRFDMSEFSQEHTVAKLIGSPPGYVGHDSGNGLLLDKIEQFPNAVLLLDEIEKADRKVLLTFLQVLDEGRLTGSQGKTVYFNNVTVIMTTNLGAADSTKRSIGMSGSDTAQDKAIKAFLPPEFINRIDSIVT